MHTRANSKKLDFFLCYWLVEADGFYFVNHDNITHGQKMYAWPSKPSLVVTVASTAAAKHALSARSTPSLRAEASIPTKYLLAQRPYLLVII
ncbi:hypothetical protein RJ639_038500 [Escallonia herrerae]|uniref:Uncharacterized protein n=1 Tax=Escallonia herrerae TaxID=1293975 RepID=A0AA88WKI9_9ASTE|nr:hypothetical protein RJ639_038500 [Escallonia herrerae]